MQLLYTKSLKEAGADSYIMSVKIASTLWYVNFLYMGNNRGKCSVQCCVHRYTQQ